MLKRDIIKIILDHHKAEKKLHKLQESMYYSQAEKKAQMKLIRAQGKMYDMCEKLLKNSR